MLYTKIRKERLNLYRNQIMKLNFLRQKKFEMLNAFGLKAYDYSKIKVMAGNGKKLTEQERAVLSVERFDKRIRELEALLKPEMDALEKQIELVDSISTNWRHAESLRIFYLYGESKKDCAIDLYGKGTKQDVKNFNDILDSAVEILCQSGSDFARIQKIVLEDWVKDECC